MAFQIKKFEPLALKKDQKRPAAIGGSGFGNPEETEVGFVDEAGRVISGCKYEMEESDDIVEFHKDITVKKYDKESNDKKLILSIDVSDKIYAKKVKVFVRKKSFELVQCDISKTTENNDEFFLFDKPIFILD